MITAEADEDGIMMRRGKPDGYRLGGHREELE